MKEKRSLGWTRSPIFRGALARALPAIPIVYERLVARPELVLRELCRQLAGRGVRVPFEPKLLRPELPRDSDGRANGKATFSPSQLLQGQDQDQG